LNHLSPEAARYANHTNKARRNCFSPLGNCRTSPGTSVVRMPRWRRKDGPEAPLSRRKNPAWRQPPAVECDSSARQASSKACRPSVHDSHHDRAYPGCSRTGHRRHLAGAYRSSRPPQPLETSGRREHRAPGLPHLTFPSYDVCGIGHFYRCAIALPSNQRNGQADRMATNR